MAGHRRRAETGHAVSTRQAGGHNRHRVGTIEDVGARHAVDVHVDEAGDERVAVQIDEAAAPAPEPAGRAPVSISVTRPSSTITVPGDRTRSGSTTSAPLRISGRAKDDPGVTRGQSSPFGRDPAPRAGGHPPRRPQAVSFRGGSHHVDPVTLSALAVVALVLVLAVPAFVVWRKGRPAASGEVFRASRFSRGDRLFPTQVALTPQSVVHYTPQWIGKHEHSIHMAHVSSVSIDTGLLFSDVIIETSGGSGSIRCRGHHKGDAVRMKQLIEGAPERPTTAAAHLPAPVARAAAVDRGSVRVGRADPPDSRHRRQNVAAHASGPARPRTHGRSSSGLARRPSSGRTGRRSAGPTPSPRRPTMPSRHARVELLIKVDAMRATRASTFSRPRSRARAWISRGRTGYLYARGHSRHPATSSWREAPGLRRCARCCATSSPPTPASRCRCCTAHACRKSSPSATSSNAWRAGA